MQMFQNLVFLIGFDLRSMLAFILFVVSMVYCVVGFLNLRIFFGLVLFFINRETRKSWKPETLKGIVVGIGVGLFAFSVWLALS